MITDLFAVASGIAPGAIDRAVPPSCRRGVQPAPVPTVTGGEAVFDFPEWTPRRSTRHFVPALSVLSASPFSVRFELSVHIDGAWSAWTATAVVGDSSGFEPLATRNDGLACDIDLFTSPAPVEGIRMRVRVRAPALRAVLASPWLATLSACDLGPLEPARAPAGTASVAVPAITQMDESPEIRFHICSPASVAMVLARWGRPVPLATLAAEILVRELNRYGVWPAAIGAAGRHGVAGYLLRFPDWAAAAWCLAAGLPVVASVRHARGELAGAAIDETDGHLLVLTGYDGDEVMINDPAAPSAASVARRYRRADLERVWLGRAGVGYVLFDPNVMTAS